VYLVADFRVQSEGALHRQLVKLGFIPLGDHSPTPGDRRATPALDVHDRTAHRTRRRFPGDGRRSRPLASWRCGAQNGRRNRRDAPLASVDARHALRAAATSPTRKRQTDANSSTQSALRKTKDSRKGFRSRRRETGRPPSLAPPPPPHRNIADMRAGSKKSGGSSGRTREQKLRPGSVVHRSRRRNEVTTKARSLQHSASLRHRPPSRFRAETVDRAARGTWSLRPEPSGIRCLRMGTLRTAQIETAKESSTSVLAANVGETEVVLEARIEAWITFVRKKKDSQ